MKELLVAAILTTCAVSAMAEWTYIYEGKESYSYLDFRTIQRNGAMRRVWMLIDLKEHPNASVNSIKAKLQFDCVKKTGENLHSISLSKRMAEGVIVHEITPMGIFEINTDDEIRAAFDIVCK